MELYYPIILDGATGTQLQKRGYTSDNSPEKWVLEHPEAYMDAQRGYIESGSNVIYAPTFTASRVKLEEYGIFGEVEELNRRLVALARETAQGRAYVGGDMSPTGKFLYPLGDMTFEEMVEVYTEQVRALESAGVDFYIIETMTSVPDARAAVIAVKENSRKPVLVTFTCDGGGKTLSGSDVTAAIVIMQGMGVDAVGLNCSSGPDDMLVQLRRMSEYAELPLIAKPNAGMPQIVGGKTVYDCPPEVFSAHVSEMAECGVMLFGGCCGTEKEHIAALKTALEGVKMNPPSPKHTGMLPCATEKLPCYLAPDTPTEKVIACSGELEEKLENELSSGRSILALSIENEDELAAFTDNQYMITKPLCIKTGSAELLEAALRAYQGRAMYDGPLDESVLLPLSKKYGLIF